ncbi:MAG: hypothetical protein ACT4QB_06970, partial [Gammaproteobacteria bacterium]
MATLTEIDYEPGRFDEGQATAPAGATPTPRLVPVDYEPEPYHGAVPDRDQGVVLPSIKRTAGHFVESVGTTLEDITGENAVTRGLQDFGGGVVRDNPSQIQSFGDVLDKPGTAIKEAIAEQVPQLGLAYGGAAGGAALGSLLGPAGAAVGGIIGGLLPIGVQEYGEIRHNQKETGREDIPLALAGAAGATALERLGLEGAASQAGRKGIKALLGEVPEGANRLTHAAKQALKIGIIEGPVTEIPQTIIERGAGGKEVATPEALDEYGVAGAKGFLGGGAIKGALTLAAPRAEGQPNPAAAGDPNASAPPGAPGAPPAPPSQGGEQAGGEVGLGDLDQAQRRHLRDILGEGLPAPGLPPPAPPSQGGGPASPPPLSDGGGQGGGPKSLREQMAERARADIASDQARFAELAARGPLSRAAGLVAPPVDNPVDAPTLPPLNPPPSQGGAQGGGAAPAQADLLSAAAAPTLGTGDALPAAQAGISASGSGEESFDVTHASDRAYTDPRYRDIRAAWGASHIATGRDGVPTRFQHDYFADWHDGGGVSTDLGGQYDAHGIAKRNPLGALLNLLEHGVHRGRRFDTAPLVTQAGASAGLGTGNGAYKDGPFIVLGQRGSPIRESGIATVLVADSVAQTIPGLQAAFPNTEFVRYSEAQNTLARQAEGPAPSDASTSGVPSTPIDQAAVTAPVVGPDGGTVAAAQAPPPTAGGTAAPQTPADAGVSASGPPARPVTPIDQAAHAAATSPLNDLPEPTEGQQKAGNYQKGHVRYAGLDISIENSKGSTRSGADAKGKPWEVEMSGHYGYIKRTKGKDGEQVDVYLASDREDTPAFVVDQADPKTGRFDEHKVVLGAATREEAEALYDAHFSDGSGPSRRQATTELPIDDFKAWLKEGNTKKPFAQQPQERALDSRPPLQGGRPPPTPPSQRGELTPSSPPPYEGGGQGGGAGLANRNPQIKSARRPAEDADG